MLETNSAQVCGRGNWIRWFWPLGGFRRRDREDAPDSDRYAEHLVKEEKTVRPSDTLQLKLAPSDETVAI
jgi:hypothetical protein